MVPASLSQSAVKTISLFFTPGRRPHREATVVRYSTVPWYHGIVNSTTVDDALRMSLPINNLPAIDIDEEIARAKENWFKL